MRLVSIGSGTLAEVGIALALGVLFTKSAHVLVYNSVELYSGVKGGIPGFPARYPSVE